MNIFELPHEHLSDAQKRKLARKICVETYENQCDF